jgi:hypothetical protein
MSITAVLQVRLWIWVSLLRRPWAMFLGHARVRP